MGASKLDVLLLVPMPGAEAYFVSRGTRREYGHFGSAFMSSALRSEARLGYSFGLDYGRVDHGEVVVSRNRRQSVLGRHDEVPHHPGNSQERGVAKSAKRRDRSLTAVALSTELERAGLSWETFDLGAAPLLQYRKILRRFRSNQPLCVGISTTYFISPEWLNCLVQLVRRYCPTSAVLAGGHMYGTNVEGFFQVDADFFLVGEAEGRFGHFVNRLKENEDPTIIPGVLSGKFDRGDGRFDLPEAKRLSEFERPDWTLSTRIQPPIDPRSEPTYMAVETQRGCLFKCKFCTFRTLQSANLLPPQDAAAAIKAFGSFHPNGLLMLTDATASFPKARWQDILERLAKQGGSRVPIFCYVRATDLDEDVIRLMVDANVTKVFIGQESGDDRILKMMAKGIRSASLLTAISALEGSGVQVIASFIHGYPGEQSEHIDVTRAYILNLNQRTAEVVVESYSLSPFLTQDLASVSCDSAGIPIPRDYDVYEEVLKTFVAGSLTDKAPNFFAILSSLRDDELDGRGTSDFRLNKLIQRQMALQMLRDKSVVLATLPKVPTFDTETRELTAALVQRGQSRRPFAWRLLRYVLAHAVSRLGQECRDEGTKRVWGVPFMVKAWELINGVRIVHARAQGGPSKLTSFMQDSFVNRPKSERLKGVEHREFA